MSVRFLLWALFLPLCLHLSACQAHPFTPQVVQQAKAEYENGYYKTAFYRLLPAAADGDKEAQYALGYMYYYGLGIPQDTQTGYFWIKRSADQGYGPAVKAARDLR